MCVDSLCDFVPDYMQTLAAGGPEHHVGCFAGLDQIDPDRVLRVSQN
jgi:hypothetical protein